MVSVKIESPFNFHTLNRNTPLIRNSLDGTVYYSYFLFSWHYNPYWVCILQPSNGAITSSRTRFLDHTQRRATVGRTPLDEWSVSRRDLYLTTHNTHNRQTSMPPGGIRTHDLSRRAAVDLRLRPRGYWDRHLIYITHINYHLALITINKLVHIPKNVQ